MQNPLSDRLVPAADVKRAFSVSGMTLWRWRKAGLLPPPIVINKRNYWHESTLASVMARVSGSEVAA